MPKTEAFERHAAAYDQWFEDNSEIYQAELQAVRSLLPESLPDATLEIGVGSGRFAAPLGIRLGLEPSPAMAEKARERGIDVVSGVAEALPFADAAFQLVLLITTICFVDDPAQAFREVWRVLRPGGQVIVGLVDSESELGRHYQTRKKKSRFYHEARFFSVAEVLTLMVAAGFQSMALRQTLFPESPMYRVEAGSGAGAFVGVRGTRDLSNN